MLRHQFITFTGTVMLAACAAQAGGYGRMNLAGPGEGHGRANLPPPTIIHRYGGGTWGLKLDMSWTDFRWDLGPASGSEKMFAPQVSLFYKTADNLDVGLSLFHVTGDDRDDELGATRGEMTRIALGVRYWVQTQGRITPYVGCGIGYYRLNGNTDHTKEDGIVMPARNVSVKDAPGAFLEGGLAFLISDGFFIHSGLSMDFLPGSADASINGSSRSFKTRAFSMNLIGVTWKF